MIAELNVDVPCYASTLFHLVTDTVQRALFLSTEQTLLFRACLRRGTQVGYVV